MWLGCVVGLGSLRCGGLRPAGRWVGAFRGDDGGSVLTIVGLGGAWGLWGGRIFDGVW